MTARRRSRLFPVLFTVILSVGAGLPAAAQQTGTEGSTSVAAGTQGGRPRSLVVLTALQAPRSDAIARKLASTITGSLSLMMKLSGDVKVRRADFLSPTFSLRRAREYYRATGANGAVYGSVAPSPGGGYRIELALWNGSNPTAPPRLFRRTLTNVLASFTMADRLALAVTSTIVGRSLAEGTLQIENTKLLPGYAIYADGHLVARNRSEVPILTGRREIVVAKPGGPLGDIPVEVFHVTIRRGTTTTVNLSAKEIASGAAGGKKLALPRSPSGAAAPASAQTAPSPAQTPAQASARAAAAGASAAGTASTAAVAPTGAAATATAAAPAGAPAPAASTAAAPRGKETALIRSASSGSLFLDGNPEGTITGGTTRLVTGITAGVHHFELRYADGHRQTLSQTFTAGAHRATVAFSYEPMRFSRARFFHPASLSIGKHHYQLKNPNGYTAALKALSNLPTVTPGIKRQMTDAKALVASWRPQRVFHIIWIGGFVAAALAATAINSTLPSTSSAAPLIGVGAILTSGIFLLINAEHRGTTIGGLTADMRSIAASYDRRPVAK